MLHALKARIRQADRQDEGFTLIELMVVVLIIAVLLAIAIPTFLGVQNKAKDRAAQSSVRNTLTAAKAMYADDSNFDGATDAALLAVEPSLTFQAAGTDSGGPKDVSVEGAGQVFSAAALSDTDTCFYIRNTANGQTEFASVPNAGGACDGGAPPANAAPTAPWSTDGW
jgi:type IV pilus assembly protein PilA